MRSSNDSSPNRTERRAGCRRGARGSDSPRGIQIDHKLRVMAYLLSDRVPQQRAGDPKCEKMKFSQEIS
jgi:hypothetical protein